MELVRNFKKLDRTNADLAGGKGASLGEMTKAGIPVPPGFVVLSESFEQFIRETGLFEEIDAILHKVNHKEIHTVEAASEAIRALILNADMPKDIEKVIMSSFKELDTKYVAVRSSATAEDGMDHAWAGQLESYLNTKESQILSKVKLCWSSLFTPRAIFYRFEKGLHTTKISVAVVVQKMVESEVSGIAFSVHPVTEDWNQLIIEAGFGLGEAIVSGSVTPDSYVVEKEPRRILDINISTQDKALYRSEHVSVEHGNNEWRDIPEPKASSQVLTEEQILELSKIILHIEKHYGFPCDIEWAFEKGTFYIVQSRPITTLAPKTGDSKKKSELAHGIGHVFKSPELKGFNPSEYDFTGQWKNNLFATCFWQDCYVPELLAELGLDSKAVRTISLAGGYFFTERSDFHNLDKQVGERIAKGDQVFFKNLLKVADRVYAETVDAGKALRDKKPTLANFRQFFIAAQRANLLWLLGATYLVETAERMLQESVVKESFPAEHVLSAIPKVITPLHHRHAHLVILSKECKGKTLEDIRKDEVLYKKLMAQVEAYPWVEVFNFIGEPLTPERLYEQIRYMEDVAENHPFVPKKPLSEEFKFRTRAMHASGYVKQAGAEYFSIFAERVQPFLKRVAEEIGITYSEFICLTTSEIESALQGKLSEKELKERAARRRGVHDWIMYSKKEGGVLFSEEPSDIAYLKETMIPKADKDAREIKGQVGNPGKYVGPARIIMNTDDFPKMKPGDVLVSTMTTPDFVILMQKSGAIVTDIGGLLCHAAIVSRELKTPCVIGTRFATHILKDNDTVEVDADSGTVRILKRASEQASVPPSKPNFVDGEDWFLTVTRNMSFWHQGLCNEGMFAHNKDYGAYANLRLLTLTVDSTKTSAFAFKANHDSYAAAVVEASNTLKKMDLLKAKYVKFTKSLLSSLAKAQKNLSPKTFKVFTDEYRRYTAGLMITTVLGRVGLEEITKRLKTIGLSDEEIPETIAVITYPEEKTPFFNSQIDLLKIGIEIQKKKLSGKRFGGALDAWLLKYGHVPVNFCEEPYSRADLKAQLKESLKSSCSDKLAMLKKQHAEGIKAAKGRLKGIGDKEVTRLAQTLAQVTTLNEFRKNMFCKVSLEYRVMFKEVARKLGSKNWRDCFYLTNDEIIAVLEGEKFDVKTKIASRQRVAMYTDKHGKNVFLSLEQTEGLHKLVYEPVASNAQSSEVLRGFSANKGKVRGVVKVILSSADFHKLLPKEVLVTTMTSVDFVPIMERAAAFVTNEGGITSHASIVAREMNKPCIIGTKIATKVLKDGDIVEVDADRGIVTILPPLQSDTAIADLLSTTTFKYVHKRVRTPFYQNFLIEGISRHHNTDIPFPYEASAVQIDGDIAFLDDRYQQLKKFSKAALAENKDFLITLLKDSYELNKKIETLALSYERISYGKVSVADMIRKWETYVNLMYKFGGYVVLPLFIEEDLEAELRNKVTKTFPENEIATVFQVLTTPMKLGVVQQEEENLLKIATKMAKKKNVSKDIDAHIRDFAWIRNNKFDGTFYSRKDIEARLKTLAKSDPESHLRQYVGKLSETKKRFDTYKNQFKRDTRAIALINTLQEAIFFRSWRTERYYRNAYFLQAFFKKTASLLKLKNEKDLFYLTAEEILNSLKGQIHPNLKKIGERKKGYVLFADTHNVLIFSGKEREPFLEKVTLNPIVVQNELRGQVAYPGKATGRACVVASISELKKIKEGDILISASTTPDFVSVLKKVKAIVAEEGGVLSHASVISRELHIPCIIGAKSATKAIKDGDVVEVDADKGIVKKL